MGQKCTTTAVGKLSRSFQGVSGVAFPRMTLRRRICADGEEQNLQQILNWKSCS